MYEYTHTHVSTGSISCQLLFSIKNQFFIFSCQEGPGRGCKVKMRYELTLPPGKPLIIIGCLVLLTAGIFKGNATLGNLSLNLIPVSREKERWKDFHTCSRWEEKNSANRIGKGGNFFMSATEWEKEERFSCLSDKRKILVE